MRWYLEAGVDETIGEEPINRFVAPPSPPASSPATPPPASAGRAVDDAVLRPPRAQGIVPSLPDDAHVEHAVALARQATDLAALREALAAFDGCPLKKTATNLVFARGRADARIALIGEAPGAEEDRQGLPFVGPSGRLLDRILASIGVDGSMAFISNTVFWRPPGNRTPTSSELAACMPFLQRMLELVAPDVLVALGGPAATTLLGRTDSVSKMRGRWFDYQSPGLARPVAATVTFHPAYLLRSPLQKRLAWRDFLAIKQRLAAP